MSTTEQPRFVPSDPYLSPEPPTSGAPASGPPMYEGTLRVGIWDAVRRHWVLTLLPAVVLVAVAVAIGVTRTPTWTAESRLGVGVGRIDIANPALGGFVTATEDLASAYSRAVTADQVVGPVASQFHLTNSDVSGRLSASPVPQSPVLRVIASGSSPADAVALANAASGSLIKYLDSVNRSNPDGPRLFAQFQQAALAAQRAGSRLRRARKAGGPHPGPGQQLAIDQANANFQAQNLRAQALSGAYQASQNGQGTTALVRVLNPATVATNDRRSTLALLGFIALIVGLAAGVALATARAARSLRLAPAPA